MLAKRKKYYYYYNMFYGATIGASAARTTYTHRLAPP